MGSEEGRSVEALRAALRDARRTTSPRTIAAQAKVSHTKVYELLGPDDASATQPDVLTALWRWVDSRRQEASDPDTVPVSRETIGYLRGKLETTVAWLGSVEQQMGALGSSVHAVGETLTALRSTLDQATSGVAGLLTPDSFPGPNGSGSGSRPNAARPRIAPEELRGREDRRREDTGESEAG